MTLGKEMWEMGREGALILSSPRGHFHSPCTKMECPLSTLKSDSRTRENILSTDIRSFLILGKEQCDKKFQLIGVHKLGNQCGIFSLVSRKQVFVDKAGKSTGKRNLFIKECITETQIWVVQPGRSGWQWDLKNKINTRC